MGERRIDGFRFWWKRSDHSPPHVHVEDEKGYELGRVRVDTMKPMIGDDLIITVKLRRALEKLMEDPEWMREKKG